METNKFGLMRLSVAGWQELTIILFKLLNSKSNRREDGC